MTFLHGASRSVLWCGTFCSLQMASALRMRFSIPCSLRSPADAAAPRAPLPSSRPPSTLTRRRPPGPGSGVGAPCRGHRGALWLRRRAPGRVGAASTKPGAGTSPAFLCLLNLVLISEKTSYYTVRKTLKDRKSAPPSPQPPSPPPPPPRALLPAGFRASRPQREAQGCGRSRLCPLHPVLWLRVLSRSLSPSCIVFIFNFLF